MLAKVSYNISWRLLVWTWNTCALIFATETIKEIWSGSFGENTSGAGGFFEPDLSCCNKI